MTDREKDVLDDEPVEDVPSDDFVLDDVHPKPGEEIDPDSLRPAPALDEEGEPIEPVIDDDGEQMGLI